MEDQRCSICLDELEKDTLHLPCGHCFHVKCILTYASSCVKDKKEVTCPLCRHVIVPIHETEESQPISGDQPMEPQTLFSKTTRCVGSILIVTMIVYGFHAAFTLRP